MSESSDTEQASIVFLGRESFRMQVVDTPTAATSAGTIPNHIWEGPTARIIERRTRDRRRSSRVAPLEALEPQIPTPARNTVIGISLMTFACGLMVATAVHRFRLRAVSSIQPVVLQAMPSPAAAPQPPALASAIVQPVQALEPSQALPNPQPAVTPPAHAPAMIPPAESEPQLEKRPVLARAKPARRAGPVFAAAGAQKPAPPPAPRATEPALFELTPLPAPRPARKWVDPFAE